MSADQAAGPQPGPAAGDGSGLRADGPGQGSRGPADPLLPGLRTPGNQVSPRAIRYWTARAIVNTLAVVAVESIVIAASSLPAAWWTAVAVTAAIGVAHAAIMPLWRFRVHRWEVTDEALFTRSGWFSVHWRIAPISRIQTVDSHRSFGERIFGLANVTATTASAAGPVHIRGLDCLTADRLLDQLALVTGQVPGDAT